jgi:TetR/AcrR family transcriptional regulator
MANTIKTDKRNPGRPVDKQSADLDSIRRSAIKEFAKQGFGGVSINALAKKVNVADSLLHYHFGSKLDLWKSCLSLVGGEIAEKFANLKKLSSDLTGSDRIKLFNKQLVYVSAEFPEFQQIVVHEVFSQSERSEWLITELMRPIYQYFEEILQEEQKKGTIKNIPSANLTSFIIGSITTLFSRSYQMKKMYGIDAFSSEEIELHADLMNELILGALLID